MKKKILWHLPFAMVGGVETLYAVILKYFKNEDFEHIVSCHSHIKQWVTLKFRENASILIFNGEDDLANSLNMHRPDLIIGTHGHTLYNALKKIDRKIPVIEVVHGSHIWSEHNVHMPKDFTKHIICVSKSAERVYLANSNFGINTSIIINGVDQEAFFPMKPVAKQSRIIGYTGRFMEGDKHIKKIIKAFKSLGDFKARLHLIGGSDAEIIHLKHFARTNGMRALIKFFPHTPHPERHFKSIDVFTVRSEAEGYCNSVAEALAAGIPSVCYNFGGILEHVPEGTILIADNQNDYARKLKEVHTNYELRKKLSEAGLRFINSEGNAKLMAQRYEKVIRQVLAGNSANETFPIITEIRTKSETKVDAIELTPITVRNDLPVVGVCNLAWHGIATATRNMSDFVIPWNANPQIMAKNALQYKSKGIVFSGMCPGFAETAQLIKRQSPKTPLYAYYHGGISHYSFSKGLFGEGERNAFQSMIDLHKRGVFRKIAVSSPGLAEVLQANGLKVEFCGNIYKENAFPKRSPDEGFHIGNWNRHHDHKHTTAALGAHQLLKGSTLHTLSGLPKIPGLDYTNVIEYREMVQSQLYDYYKKMHINVQMSFIETFNISAMELWAAGRPLIIGAGNHVLVENNPLLKELTLVVDQTNPIAIANKIELAMKKADLIVEEQFRQLAVLNKQTQDRWDRFFL